MEWLYNGKEGGGKYECRFGEGREQRRGERKRREKQQDEAGIVQAMHSREMVAWRRRLSTSDPQSIAWCCHSPTRAKRAVGTDSAISASASLCSGQTRCYSKTYRRACADTRAWAFALRLAHISSVYASE
eukprot:5202805-Pleurochrysis_carterae.AAC.1